MGSRNDLPNLVMKVISPTNDREIWGTHRAKSGRVAWLAAVFSARLGIGMPDREQWRN
jgi:hypothetical protein